jgi:transposase-like protein
MPRPINRANDMNLLKLIDKYDSDDKCRQTLEKLRWPLGVRCIRCDAEKVFRAKKRNQFECGACGYHFSVTTGTIMHDTHLPLRKWFIATYLICESKKGVSALQLKRTLGVAYKTAWYLCHRIREAVKDVDHSELLSGIVECDEAFIGGNPKNMHAKRKAKLKRVEGSMRFDHKIAVLGALQRDGDVRLEVCRDKRITREVLHEFIKSKLSDETELIATDENNQYEGIADANTKHETVSHTQKEWVRGVVHTNGLEGVWSLFKRSIVGSYHQISVKHLDRYLDEFEFRFNNRENSFLFRDTLLRLLNSTNLEYKNLIADEDEATAPDLETVPF